MNPTTRWGCHSSWHYKYQHTWPGATRSRGTHKHSEARKQRALARNAR